MEASVCFGTSFVSPSCPEPQEVPQVVMIVNTRMPGLERGPASSHDSEYSEGRGVGSRNPVHATHHTSIQNPVPSPGWRHRRPPSFSRFLFLLFQGANKRWIFAVPRRQEKTYLAALPACPIDLGCLGASWEDSNSSHQFTYSSGMFLRHPVIHE